jgi:hypothetical protein
VAKWSWMKGRPEWHPLAKFEDTMRDGTVITAQLEDCDGDVEYWHVKEDGVLVAHGECWAPQDGEAAQHAERVICFGATAEQRAAAAAKMAKETEIAS